MLPRNISVKVDAVQPGESVDGGERGRPICDNIVASGARSGQCGRPGERVKEATHFTTVGKEVKDGQGEMTAQMMGIYNRVVMAGGHNYNTTRIRVPSGLNMEAWREWLKGYHDRTLAEFLEFGWPVNFDRRSPLGAMQSNHPSAMACEEHIDFYVDTERRFGALLGPFSSPPFRWLHLSPLMTRSKRDTDKRRVIMDLSWPPGQAINDGIQTEWYLDGPAKIRLPTVDYMEGRLLELGRGAFLYKTDLARGYRQLRVDPGDWPLLGFTHRGRFYVDVCPPFGLRTSAMCMQRTTEAISWMHQQVGYISRPYLDDFGGAERTIQQAEAALTALQSIMADLGVREAETKICRPATSMVWLGLLYDSEEMTITIPPEKLGEIMTIMGEWQGRTRATRKDMQRLLGLLQFVASVSPPTRIFTNRMLSVLRDMPQRGSETLSLEFKKDVKFFVDMLPEFNGIKVVEKGEVSCQERLELDACLLGCGAFTGECFYAERFPQWLVDEGHSIAHLELLNVVVALKVWCVEWRGQRVDIRTDNTNACLALQTGRSRDPFVQHCVREVFVYCARYDIELCARHQPGRELVRADALSRMFIDARCEKWVREDRALQQAKRVAVPESFFRLLSEI